MRTDKNTSGPGHDNDGRGYSWAAQVGRSEDLAMPIHDWSHVDAGIFHAFHHDWITDISRALNRGLLPSDYYALPEQIAGGVGPDVLTLQRPANGSPPVVEPTGGVLAGTAPPKVQLRLRAEPDLYAAKAKAVVV